MNIVESLKKEVKNELSVLAKGAWLLATQGHPMLDRQRAASLLQMLISPKS